MFCAFAAAHKIGVGNDAGRLRGALGGLATLTPGDFATVGRQLGLLGKVGDPWRIVAALQDECRAKRDEGASAKPVGFR